MNCTNPVIIITENPKKVNRYGCGQCINCKTRRAKEWTNRLMDEATQHKDISIIVLTYDNEHIHYGKKAKHGRWGTLWHRDVQLYIKRLKIDMDRMYKKGKLEIPGKNLKYFIAGEYGSKKYRPHYHVVLYGLMNLIRNIKKKRMYCNT